MISRRLSVFRVVDPALGFSPHNKDSAQLGPSGLNYTPLAGRRKNT
jgi:hypothetical protein